jgi:hypothetical protein
VECRLRPQEEILPPANRLRLFSAWYMLSAAINFVNLKCGIIWRKTEFGYIISAVMIKTVE